MVGIRTLGPGDSLWSSVWVFCFVLFFSCESLEWICVRREGVHGHGQSILALFYIKATLLGVTVGGWSPEFRGSLSSCPPCSQLWPRLGARGQNHLWTGREKGVCGGPGQGAGPGPDTRG